MYSFASDNHAGAHTAVLEAIVSANEGHAGSYGTDLYTARLDDIVRAHFGPMATAYPVFNGTGANVVALQAMQPNWGGVICTTVAHINTDEGAAPERMAGLKLLPIEAPDGRLTPELIRWRAQYFGNEHHAQPSTVSLTQSTEVGTVYGVEEVREICEYSHALGINVHMDGARLANAAATLGVSLRSLTTDVGVDVVSFGGTKNGLLFGELVIVLNPALDPGIKYVRKFNAQLASKMRFISAQFIALLGDDLWLESARMANHRASQLRSLVEQFPNITLTQPTEANAIFAVLPPDVEKELREIADFQTWDPVTGEVRWMCSYDTSESDVVGFAEALGKLLRAVR